MTIKKVLDIVGIGTTKKIFGIKDSSISEFWVIGYHPHQLYQEKDHRLVVLGTTANVHDAIIVPVIDQKMRTEWAVDYEDAKNIMWEQYIKLGKTLREVYFDDVPEKETV